MDKAFMQEAIAQAREGIRAGHGGPFGAVVVKDGKIVGRGHNRVISSHDPTMHGEIAAIRDACAALGSHQLTGCTLYTTAQPCPMCLSAIFWSGITEVYYGCTIEDTSGIGFRDEEFYARIRGGEGHGSELCRAECLEVFKEYSSSSNREKY